MNVKKEARRDAHEYARSAMFYGEGAGTRRKLIQAAVETKAWKDPNYKREFDRALGAEDMGEHAARARSERRRKDAQTNVSKNVRAMARGDRHGMSTSLVVLIGLATIANKTGYDKKIYEATTTQYNKLARKVRVMKAERELRKNPVI